ncbi:MAG: GDSL-type esterase/lipase family protein [Sedimentisphaerales bacterium]|nr:GDSL-type esterase/lipase family protein [Sedimentisphaerales bacterium]
MERLLSVVGVVLAILGKRALRVFLPIAAVLVFSCAVQAAGVTRIMPLGDSITRGWWGSAYSWGYRKPLYDSLTNGGYSFDFVGSGVDGNFPDPQHEGHDGWRTVQILSNVNGWLIAYRPDVVLLHIGTNDITQGYHDANQVNNILNAIDAYEVNNNEYVTVVLALMINRRIDSPAIKRSQTTQFNRDVNDIALNRIANGDDIIIVDMESALNYSIGVDMADEVHPNDNGYSKMAGVWYDALADYVLPLAISGYVLEADGNTPVEGVLIQADGNDVFTATDANGYYELWAYRGWSSVVVAQKDRYIFEPNNFSYTDVNHNYTDMNYAATLMTFKIAGFVFEQDSITPMNEVNVSADNGGGSTLTDADGYYEIVVGYNWSGNVKPGRYAYGFEPNSRHYENVNQNYPAEQDYTGNKFDFRITGYIRDECNAPVEGVLVDANNGGGESTTDADGFYEVWVDSAWSGVVTPSRQHYTFEPNRMDYIEVFADQTDQNYSAHNVYDLDRDGFIGWSDFDLMAGNWMLAGPAIQGDFVVDGIVNFLDFADFEKVRQGG